MLFEKGRGKRSEVEGNAVGKVVVDGLFAYHTEEYCGGDRRWVAVCYCRHVFNTVTYM
jgi:hypothetical protein